MRFDVMKPGARLIRDLLQLFQLIGQHTGQIVQSKRAIPLAGRGFQYIRPAKTGPVGIRRVSTDRHAMPQGQFHRLPHRTGISGMSAAGYIRRTDKGKDYRIRIHAFAHVAIEVNF
jgi:hypothetical protein